MDKINNKIAINKNHRDQFQIIYNDFHPSKVYKI
jgi:hypothetical protein